MLMLDDFAGTSTHAASCRGQWGRLEPEVANSSAHPQMPPSVCAGVFAPDFCARSSDEGCSGLARALIGSSLRFLWRMCSSLCQALSPPYLSSEAVWRSGEMSCHPTPLCEFCTRATCVRRPRLPPLSPRSTRMNSPSLARLSPLCSPRMASLSGLRFVTHLITYSFCTWPWEFAGPLKAATKQAAWVSRALSTLCKTLAASAHCPVALELGEPAAAAIPQAVAWLFQGGFVRDKGFLRTRICLLEARHADPSPQGRRRGSYGLH